MKKILSTSFVLNNSYNSKKINIKIDNYIFLKYKWIDEKKAKTNASPDLVIYIDNNELSRFKLNTEKQLTIDSKGVHNWIQKISINDNNQSSDSCDLKLKLHLSSRKKEEVICIIEKMNNTG